MKKRFFIVSLLLLFTTITIFIAQYKFFIFNPLLQKKGYVLSNETQQNNQAFRQRNIENLHRFFDKIDAKGEAKLTIIEQNGLKRILHTVYYKQGNFRYTNTHFKNFQLEKDFLNCDEELKTPYFSKSKKEHQFELECMYPVYPNSIHTLVAEDNIRFTMKDGYAMILTVER